MRERKRCKVCGLPAHARELCKRHYIAGKRAGEWEQPECKREGCTSPVAAHELCAKCWQSDYDARPDVRAGRAFAARESRRAARLDDLRAAGYALVDGCYVPPHHPDHPARLAAGGSEIA